tara:strand:+ start:1387 stop:1548 length:162 start_codon:yes stop_codon:yes gene_type:complete
MDMDYAVPNLPFPYAVTYGGLLKMCEYFTDKIRTSPLDNIKEAEDGFKLHTKE